MQSVNRIEHIIQSFAEKRIIVVGDLMLDEFIWGEVSRVSPEAPVPVVEVKGESYYPGGAANVARNVAEFASGVTVIGAIGKDVYADRLKNLLAQAKIKLDAVQDHHDSPTTVKTRVIARHQQVVRVDREKQLRMSPAQIERTMAQLGRIVPECDALIIADYGKGFVQQELVNHLCELARQAGKILTVDPNANNPLDWPGVTAIKPNRKEAFAAAAKVPTDPVEPVVEDEPLLAVGRILLSKWKTELLLITLGEHGMLMFDRAGATYHTPTKAREVFDVSGAGDTALALLTLALSGGASPAEAAEIANHASSIVVGKLGTATVSRAELMASFARYDGGN